MIDSGLIDDLRRRNAVSAVLALVLMAGAANLAGSDVALAANPDAGIDRWSNDGDSDEPDDSDDSDDPDDVDEPDNSDDSDDPDDVDEPDDSDDADDPDEVGEPDDSDADEGADDDSSGSDEDDEDDSGSDDESDDDSPGSDEDDDDNSGSGDDDDEPDDESSGSDGDDDDNSGSGSDDESDDDSSGGDDSEGDNSGHGGGDDNSDGDNSGQGGDGEDNSSPEDSDGESDDDNGSGSDDSDDDTDNSGSGGEDASDDGGGSDDSGRGSAGSGHGGDTDALETTDTADILEAADVEADREGFNYRRGEIVAIDLEPADLEMARELGFEVEAELRLDALGGAAHILRAPKGGSPDDALGQLKGIAPRGAFALNHLFLKPQAGRAPTGPATPYRAPPCRCRIGMLDTGVSPSPLPGVNVRQRAFGGRVVKPDEHGTGVASMMFAASGDRSELFVADVFSGEGSSAGAASSIVRALEWLASTGATVINISLAGPPNPVVERVIAKLAAKGVIVIAAVGNDGPAAPPAFPAAYPGVLGVTAVDASNAVYRYAGRGDHIDFAAVGVAVRVARRNGSYALASGTSFSAPVVAATIAHDYQRTDPRVAREVVRSITARATDLGAPGRDRTYGAGLVSPPK